LRALSATAAARPAARAPPLLCARPAARARPAAAGDAMPAFPSASRYAGRAVRAILQPHGRVEHRSSAVVQCASATIGHCSRLRG